METRQRAELRRQLSGATAPLPVLSAKALRRALNRHTRDSLPHVFMGTSAIFLFLWCYHLWGMPGAASLPLLLHDVCLSLGCLGFALAIQRWHLPSKWANPALAILSVAVAANPLLIDSPPVAGFGAVFAMAVLIVFGNFISSTPWQIFVTLSIVGTWVAGTLVSSNGPGPWLSSGAAFDYSFAVFLGAAVAVTIHFARVRAWARILQLRQRDVHIQAVLEESLTATEQALNDRIEAEKAQRELEDQLIQAQKMEALGTLAGGVAHDLNNMLSVITGLASKLKDETHADDPRRKDMGSMLEAARRSAELTRNLLGFARKGKYRQEDFWIQDIVEEVVQLLHRTVPKNIAISTELHEDRLAGRGDPHQLTQAVMNICLNSVQAMPHGGELHLSTRSESVGPGEGTSQGMWLVLEVRDTGCGMDEATRKRVFEPFFSTKEPGRGTGLGLSMVYGTVTRHNGLVSVRSHPRRGTAVDVKLPAWEKRSRSRRASSESCPAVTNGADATILVVDDEPLVRATTLRILGAAGYNLVVATNGEEAVDLFQQHPVDLVLLDMSMPVMDGATCFRRLKEMQPDVQVLLCSGYTAGEATQKLLSEGAVGLLNKPFDYKALMSAVAGVLNGGDAPSLPPHQAAGA
jgi:signal transduction histidine kinase/ActR/RegA family two-component response regulator